MRTRTPLVFVLKRASTQALVKRAADSPIENQVAIIGSQQAVGQNSIERRELDSLRAPTRGDFPHCFAENTQHTKEERIFNQESKKKQITQTQSKSGILSLHNTHNTSISSLNIITWDWETGQHRGKSLRWRGQFESPFERKKFLQRTNESINQSKNHRLTLGEHQTSGRQAVQSSDSSSKVGVCHTIKKKKKNERFEARVALCRSFLIFFLDWQRDTQRAGRENDHRQQQQQQQRRQWQQCCGGRHRISASQAHSKGPRSRRRSIGNQQNEQQVAKIGFLHLWWRVLRAVCVGTSFLLLPCDFLLALSLSQFVFFLLFQLLFLWWVRKEDFVVASPFYPRCCDAAVCKGVWFLLLLGLRAILFLYFWTSSCISARMHRPPSSTPSSSSPMRRLS